MGCFPHVSSIQLRRQIRRFFFLLGWGPGGRRYFSEFRFPQVGKNGKRTPDLLVTLWRASARGYSPLAASRPVFVESKWCCIRVMALCMWWVWYSRSGCLPAAVSRSLATCLSVVCIYMRMRAMSMASEFGCPLPGLGDGENRQDMGIADLSRP